MKLFGHIVAVFLLILLGAVMALGLFHSKLDEYCVEFKEEEMPMIDKDGHVYVLLKCRMDGLR